MTVYQIVYNKLRLVWANASNLGVADLDRAANSAVEEIRDEFRKAGVDVWPRWEGGEK